MQLTLILVIFFKLILLSKCERKFLKIENCTSNAKVTRIEQCEIKNGKFEGVFNILESLDEFMVKNKSTKNC